MAASGKTPNDVCTMLAVLAVGGFEDDDVIGRFADVGGPFAVGGQHRHGTAESPVQCAEPGDSAGYGRRFVAAEATDLAVLPIGYGDGVRRGLTNNADVLIAGARRPLVGTVSMVNLTVDLGPEPAVGPGAEAVLIGADGPERITAEEVARRLGTINYEITCGITARVPRIHHRDGAQP